MNKRIMRGKMRQMRGKMKEKWARLTDDDVRMLDGKIDQAIGLLQERYGYTSQKAMGELGSYLNDYEDRAKDFIDDTIEKLGGKTRKQKKGPSFISILWVIGAIAGALYLFKQFAGPLLLSDSTPKNSSNL